MLLLGTIIFTFWIFIRNGLEEKVNLTFAGGLVVRTLCSHTLDI